MRTSRSSELTYLTQSHITAGSMLYEPVRESCA